MTDIFRILSLDGGGIRGAATAQVLLELEQDLGASLYDSFDLIAGTSTGGLLALYLAAERASGQTLVDMYSPRNAQRIMNKSFWDRHLSIQNEPKYDGTGKTAVLNEYFGDKRIQDVDKPVLITAYDIIARKVVVYKSTGGSDSRNNPKLSEIGNATSAAPTYFPTIKTADKPPRWLIDGGVSANNPSMCALAEALKKQHKPENIRLLSIGTGTPIRGNDTPADIGEQSQEWGGIGWLGHGLIDHLFAGNSTTADYHCKVLLGDGHVRVNGELKGVLEDLDEVSEGNIGHLKALGSEWYRANKQAILGIMTQ